METVAEEEAGSETITVTATRTETPRISVVLAIWAFVPPVLAEMNPPKGHGASPNRGQWLDVRLPSEFQNLAIEGSINIPLYFVRLKLNALDRKMLADIAVNEPASFAPDGASRRSQPGWTPASATSRRFRPSPASCGRR